MVRIVRVVRRRENVVKTLSHEPAASRSGTKRIFRLHDALGTVSADSSPPRHELDSPIPFVSLPSSVLRPRLVTLRQSDSPTQSVGTRRFDATASGRTTRATGIDWLARRPLLPPRDCPAAPPPPPGGQSQNFWTVPFFLDSPYRPTTCAHTSGGVRPGQIGESRRWPMLAHRVNPEFHRDISLAHRLTHTPRRVASKLRT